MKLLITGICGFAGSEIAVTLTQHFDSTTLQISGIDNLSRNGSWRNRERLTQHGIHVQHGDIRCQTDIEAIGRVDWVLDAAANPSVLAGINGQSGSRQLMDANLLSTINLLEHCKQNQAGLILLSTSRVYSIPPLASLPVVEKAGAFSPDTAQLPNGVSANGISEKFSTASPVSLYGATKLASEQLALEYGHSFGFPVWINRCGVMAGAGQFGKADQGIFAFWLHCWKENRALKYIGFDGAGHQVRDCLHPRDLVPLLWTQMLTTPANQPRIANVSGGLNSATSLRQLSQWCEHRWGQREVTHDATPRPFDLPWIVLDSGEASRVWGWQPETSVQEILSEIADFAETQSDWIDLSQ